MVSSMVLSVHFIYANPLSLYSSESILDQQQNISGTITDENGVALPGVAVVEKGTSNGSVSDFDGNYEISVSNGATLVLSYLGYLTQEIAVDGRVTIDVQMEPDAAQLDEVVVVGYGKQKKDQSYRGDIHH